MKTSWPDVAIELIGALFLLTLVWFCAGMPGVKR